MNAKEKDIDAFPVEDLAQVTIDQDEWDRQRERKDSDAVREIVLGLVERGELELSPVFWPARG